MELVKHYLEWYEKTGREWFYELAMTCLDAANWQVWRDYRRV